MAIAPTAGTTASGASQVSSSTITVPSGIKGGDVVLVPAFVVPISSATAGITAASTGTTPVQAGSPVSGSEPLPATVTGVIFYFIAAGTLGSASSDVGKVITFTYSVAGFPGTALQGYSGANTSSPIDVIGGAFGGAQSASVTCPSKTTGVAGDWALYCGGGAAEGGGLTGPSGATSRQSVVNADDIAAAIYDSNGSAGASGTGIGGGTFSTATATNSVLVAFTVGLAAAVSAVPSRVLITVPGLPWQAPALIPPQVLTWTLAAPQETDAAGAAEALSVAASVSFTDAAGAYDQQAPYADEAGAADAVAVTAAVPLGDDAAGADWSYADGSRPDEAAAADTFSVTVAGIAPAVIQAPPPPPPFPWPSPPIAPRLIYPGGGAAAYTDSAGAADALSVSVSAPLADAGAAEEYGSADGMRLDQAGGIETLAVAAAVALPDEGAAAERAYADGSRTDPGAAADVLAVSAAVALGDEGGAEEYGAPDGMRQDVGGAADALSLAASVPLGDAAGASEWSCADGSRDDAAGAAEALAASVTVPLGDAGGAPDTFNAGNPYVYELGAAADALVTQVTSAPPAVIAGPAPLPPPLPAIAPQVIGGQSPPVPVSLGDEGAAADWSYADGSRPDAAAASDALAASVAVSLADIAAAAELTPVTVPDAAGAAEAVSVAATAPEADAGAAGDLIASAVTGAGWPDSAGGTEAIAVRSSVADTGHVRWSARLWQPRWTASLAGSRWNASLAGPRWKAVIMGPNDIAASSLEFLNILWTAELAGTEIDPTGQTSGEPQLTVQFAMPLSSGDPLAPAEPSDWFSADWLTGTNIRGYVCQGLLGPSPAPFQMTAGQQYDAWSQILGTPEAPVKFCGAVTAI